MSDRPNILVIDDEPFICRSLKEVLSQNDYAIQTAFSVKKAIRRLDKRPFDIALLDIVMQGVDGFQVMDHIARQSLDVSVIIMTGHATVETAVEALKRGAYWYLRKPFDNEELLRLVNNALAQRRLQVERRRAELELKRSEERFRILFESAPDAYYLNDLKGNFIDGNKAAEELIGYDRGELIGKNFVKTKILPSSQIPKAAKALAQGLLGKPTGIDEFALIRRDGEKVFVEIRTHPVKIEGKPLVLGIARDITGRKLVEEALKKARDELEKEVEKRTNELIKTNEQLKQEIEERKIAENALRESEKRYRRLVDFATDTFILHDLEGRIRDVNQHACDNLGYTREELLTLSIEDIDVKFHSGRHQDIWKNMVPGVPVVFEGVQRRRDGTTFPVEIRVGLHETNEGKLMLGLVRDISKRKQAAEEKKKLEAQLQRAQKMEAIGTLAGGVAHDLNNILAGIVSYPDLLLMQLQEDSPLRKPVLTIKESGKKAAAIVQDLLTLARRGVTTTKVLNLNAVISEYLKSPEHAKLLSYHPNVEIQTSLQKDLFNILGSRVHLSKTIMNLVSNAAEAMPEGGKIFISTRSLYIDRPISRYDHLKEGEYITLTIADNGIGISKEDMERIFEPFYTKKVMGRSGTGLGMPVVWGTVKDHSGYIDLQSAEGRGTTFTLYFPVTREEASEDKSRLHHKDYGGHGELILVVDDVIEQREIAFMILSELGYSVTTVSSGEEAVEYLKNQTVDLLILDMIMSPGMDGYETYRKILEFHPGQKAIITSGYSETDRAKEAQRRGAGKYIKKPYSIEKIGIAVKEELGKAV